MRPCLPLLAVLASSSALRMSSSTEGASTLRQLLGEVSALSLSKQRAVAACVGACVADAAARPMHWLYDGDKLESIVASFPGTDVAFWPESVSPYYTMKTGANSCYYDLGLCMLKALSRVPSAEDEIKTAFEGELRGMFGPGTEYNMAFLRRNEKYDPTKRYEKRDPIDGPWQQSSVTVWVETNGSGNPSSKETDGLVSTLPLIAQLSASSTGSVISSEGQELVRKLAAVLSTNAFALSHTLSAAAILSAVINSPSADGDVLTPGLVLEAVAAVDDSVIARAAAVEGEAVGKATVLAELAAVVEAVEKDPTGSNHVSLVLQWGKPCANPGSFQGACHAALTSRSFAEGTRKTVRAGGCNCSRANLAGALLGARFGLLDEAQGGIPAEWILKADKGLEVLRLAIDKLK